MTTRSATFVGGAQDGRRLVLESGPLPSSLIVDGEAYRLSVLGRMASYVAQRSWGYRRRFDADAKTAFLGALAGGMTVANAARSIGLSPSPVYNALNADPVFTTAYAAAQRRKRSAALPLLSNTDV